MSRVREGQRKDFARFDPRVRVGLSLLVLFACLLVIWPVWEQRSDRLDLELVPVGLSAGLALGLVTGRWRWQGLREVSELLGGRILWREKPVFSGSEPGQKALNAEKIAYALAFMFLIAWGAYVPAARRGSTPLATTASFLFGLWLTGQTIPYMRVWLGRRKNRL